MPTLKVVLSIIWKTVSLALLVYVFIYAIDEIKHAWKSSPLQQADFYFYYYSFEIICQHKDPVLLYDRVYLMKWLLQHGFPTFNPQTFLGFFGYPPHFAVLLSGLASWDLDTAKRIWVNLCNSLYLIGVLMVLSILYKGKKLECRLFLISLAFVSYGFISDTYFGQSNRLIFFLLSATFYLFYKKKKAWLAGLPLGVAMVFKLTPIIPFFFLFLLRRQWKVCLSTLLFTFLTTWLTASMVGWALIRDYFLIHLKTFNKINMSHGGAPWNSSFHGILESYGVHSLQVDKFYFAFILLLVLLLTIFLLRKRGDAGGDISLATLGMLLLPPVFEVHYLVLTTFALLTVFSHLANRIESEGEAHPLSSIIQLIIALFIVWLSLSPPVGNSYFMILLLLLFLSLWMYQHKKEYKNRKMENSS